MYVQVKKKKKKGNWMRGKKKKRKKKKTLVERTFSVSLIKQTSFTVKKNLVRNLPEKQSTIIKRSFISSTKPLSLGSTISLDELTVKTFYRFRTFELFNI